MPGGVVRARPASHDAGGSVLPDRGAADQADHADQANRADRRHRPSHRAPHDTHRGAMTAAGVLVALGAAVTTLALVGPDASLVRGPLGDAGTATQRPQVQELLATGSSPVAGRAVARACWDGATVTAVRDCDVPAGRAGLATVFAGVRAGCRVTEPEVAGKLEVVTCRASDHVVRYTRWTAGYDRFSWFDDEHAGRGTRWRVGGEFAGRTWTASEQTADGVTHDRWTATYRAWPLSVEVQATTVAGRAAGVAEVGAIAPTLVGLQ